MDVLRIAAFSDGTSGGNPAGVVISDSPLDKKTMQDMAAEIGYSETAFAHRKEGGWRVRYFSPENEVPFCGHATIALGAALAMNYGDGTYPLELNAASISVEGTSNGTIFSASLRSPATKSKKIDPALLADILALFALRQDDLNPLLPPAEIHAGANHALIAVNSRKRLAQMVYDLDAGRKLMVENGLVTIAFIFAENDRLFHARNAFASGGVFEDPATGAAAAALAGYLRDLDWPHQGSIDIIQGEDMGMRSLIGAEISAVAGAPIKVSGTARILKPENSQIVD